MKTSELQIDESVRDNLEKLITWKLLMENEQDSVNYLYFEYVIFGWTVLVYFQCDKQ